MRRILLGILLSVFGMHSFAQSSGLDPFTEASSSSIPRLSQEVWNESSLEYFSIDITLSNLTVEISPALEQEEQVKDADNCVGSTLTNPSFRFIWDRMSIDEELPMRLFAVAGGDIDLILVIREPDGDWICADNYENTRHPYIDLQSLRAGTYNVWIGAKEVTPEDEITSRLFVTIGDQTPDVPPPSCCVGLSFSNPASGDSDPSLAYIEIDTLNEDAGDTTLQISADVILRGQSGDTFLIELTPIDPATLEPLSVPGLSNEDECALSQVFCVVEALRRGTERRLDYTGNTSEPVIFEVNVADLVSDPSDVGFILSISKLDASGNPGDALVRYEILDWNE